MSEASGWGPPGAEKNLDLPDQDDEGYDDKSEDSKTMRLTLMEEVLLLGIKDREVIVIKSYYRSRFIAVEIHNILILMLIGYWYM